MPIDPMQGEQPLSPEFVAGESYIPQEQEFAVPQMPQQPKRGIATEQDLRGRVPDDARDFDLTMSGVQDGDPLGMETFDLGFYEDGTPLIRINGANVPIQHAQWMALLTMRNRTRAEMKAQMEFERNRLKARDGIGKIMRSAPNIPPQLGELLLTIADMNPEYALRETSDLLGSMARDNGRSQIGRLSALVQDTATDSEMGRLLRKQKKVVKDAYNFDVEVETSPIQERLSALQAETAPRMRKTAYAIGNLQSMFPPKGMKAVTGGASVGIFDMAVDEGMETGDLSRFDLLRHLAAYSDLWEGLTVPWKDPPRSMGGYVGPSVRGPIDWSVAPPEWVEYRKYMQELDAWARAALKWDYSNPMMVDAMATQSIMSGLAAGAQAQQQQGQQQAQQAQPQQQAPSGFNF